MRTDPDRDRKTTRYWREIPCSCSNRDCTQVTREQLFRGYDFILIDPDEADEAVDSDVTEEDEKRATSWVLWIFAGKAAAVVLLVVGYYQGWFDGVLK